MIYKLFWLRQSGRINQPELLYTSTNLHSLLRFAEDWRQRLPSSGGNIGDDTFFVEVTLSDGTSRKISLGEAKLQSATQLDDSLENILQSLSDVRSGGRRGGTIGGRR
jgi:hypothetical protein